MPGMTAKEHLAWAKARAIEYLDNDDVQSAWGSFLSDMRKHRETADHPALMLGMGLMINGDLNTVAAMRDFIEGFN